MGRKRKRRDYIPRKEFKFWLRTDRDDDLRLMEFIRFCKATRSFTRMVKNGLRLMWSLGEGNTSILFELFPYLKDHVGNETTPPPDTGKLERQIEELRIIILEQGYIAPPPSDYPQMKPALGGLKKMALPLFDDDDGADTLVLTKGKSTTTGDNFIASFLKGGF